jgi:hypothetical protein
MLSPTPKVMCSPVLFIFLLAWLPLTGIYFVAMSPLGAHHPPSLIRTVASAVLAAVTTSLPVALASRIFQALADRLVRPLAVEGRSRA